MNNASLAVEVIEAVAWFCLSGVILSIAVYVAMAAVGLLISGEEDV